MFNINVCWWLDLNRGPLELEATALPTEPQPLPNDKNKNLLRAKMAFKSFLLRKNLAIFSFWLFQF